MSNPPQPIYILRGHSSQLHALHFFRQNTRLITGDAEGWIAVWNTSSRRPVAVWKAHDSAILGVKTWQEDKVITHGRDHKLYVWKFTPEEEGLYSTKLPVDAPESVHRQKPWLLYSLAVNALNFCAFSMVQGLCSEGCVAQRNKDEGKLLIVVPSSKNSDAIDIYELPSGNRVYAAIGGHDKSIKTGMAMATKIVYIKDILHLIAGFESGHAQVFTLSAMGTWEMVYTSKSHSQPVLSLDIHPLGLTFTTSSADAIIAEHRLPPINAPSTSILDSKSSSPPKEINTRHAGQQSLSYRNDGKIFATAGWDGKVRVYSASSMKELAVLKWHKEGCYAVTFGDVVRDDGTEVPSNINGDGQDNEEERQLTILTAEQRRLDKVKNTHWLAAGSKDGKVSLWELY